MSGISDRYPLEPALDTPKTHGRIAPAVADVATPLSEAVGEFWRTVDEIRSSQEDDLVVERDVFHDPRLAQMYPRRGGSTKQRAAQKAASKATKDAARERRYANLFKH